MAAPSPYPEGPTLALNTHTILVTRRGILTAVERNRTGTHTNVSSAGNNAKKITAEGRKSEGSNSKTIVSNAAACLRALHGLGHLLALILTWTPPTWSGTYAEPTRY